MLRLQPTLVKVSREEIEETKVRLAEKQRTYAHRIPLACQQLAPSMIRIQPGPGRSRNGALVHADPARHIARSATTSDGPDCEPGTEASRAHSPIDSRGATTQDTKREITNASVQNPSQPRSSEHVHAHDNPARKECSSHQVGNRYPALLELDGSTEHTTASDGAPRRRRQIPRSAGSTSGSQSSVVILDPVAPPFVPRIRFGSADDGTRRQHPVRGYVNAVPSQNVRPQAAYTQNAPRQRRASGSRNNWPGNGRRRVENSSGHQQNHVPRIESTTVLDRYPVLIPLSGDAHSRLLPPQPSFTSTPDFARVAGLRAQAIPARPHRIPPRLSRPRPQAESTLGLGSTTHHQAQQHHSVTLTYNTVSEAAEGNPHRDAQSTRSSISYSTPNLSVPAFIASRIHARGSSLTWSRTPPQAQESNQASNPVSAASAISASSSRPSSALANVHIPTSPLHDLELRMQRLSGSAPPSKPRSSSPDQHGHQRSPLLTGSLFYSVTDADDCDTSPILYRPSTTRQASPDDGLIPATAAISPFRIPLATLGDDIAEDLSLPADPQLATLGDGTAEDLSLPANSAPSTPPRLTSPALPSRPVPNPATPPQLEPEPAPSKFPRTEPRLRSVPRVPVYDNAIPASLQPQTPADLPRHRDWRHPLVSPGVASATAVRSWTRTRTGTGSRTADRNTYPSIRRGRGIASEQENEFDVLALGLVAEREVWRGRMGVGFGTGSAGEGGAGGLVVTPPREGRWERFLRG